MSRVPRASLGCGAAARFRPMRSGWKLLDINRYRRLEPGVLQAKRREDLVRQYCVCRSRAARHCHLHLGPSRHCVRPITSGKKREGHDNTKTPCSGHRQRLAPELPEPPRSELRRSPLSAGAPSPPCSPCSPCVVRENRTSCLCSMGFRSCAPRFMATGS
jgi:hypothetical protein